MTEPRDARDGLIAKLNKLVENHVDVCDRLDAEFGRGASGEHEREEQRDTLTRLVANVSAILRHPVPRCDACQWWETTDRDVLGFGSCLKFNSESSKVRVSSDGEVVALKTLPDFGCVQFTAKDGKA